MGGSRPRRPRRSLSVTENAVPCSSQQHQKVQNPLEKARPGQSQGAPPPRRERPDGTGLERGRGVRTRLNQGSWRMSGPRLWRTTGRWHSAVTYSRGCWERRSWRRRRRSGARDRRRFREMDAIPAPAAASRGGSGRWRQVVLSTSGSGASRSARRCFFANYSPAPAWATRAGVAGRGCPVFGSLTDARAADSEEKE